MGADVLCGSGDGQPAVYMITDLTAGGNTLVCAGHWLDLCAAMVAAAATDQPAGVPVPPPDPTPPAGPSPTAPSAEDTDTEPAPTPAPAEGDGERGFAPETIDRAMADFPAGGAPPPAPKQPRKRARA